MTLHLETDKDDYIEFFNQRPRETDNTGFKYDTVIKTGNINIGIEDLLASTFPIRQDDDMVTLEYAQYDVRLYSSDGESLDLSEIGSDGLFYRHSSLSEASFYTQRSDLMVTLYHVLWDTNAENGDRSVNDIRQQDVCFGPLPRMTVNGTFIHGGVEKRYAGVGSVIDRINTLFEQAFIGIAGEIKCKFATLDTKEATPYDFVETWPLENETSKFLEELVPVTLH